jgi:hypothetical protein
MWSSNDDGKFGKDPSGPLFALSTQLATPEYGSVVLNGEDLLSSNESAQDFARALEMALSRGYGFIPFLGAGLSAPSGIPLIWDLKPYLQRCIGMALGIEPERVRPWNPRSDQWPQFVATEETEQAKWVHRIQEKIDAVVANDRYDRDLPVLQEALGAIAEWRTSLQFLSRLAHEERGEGFSRRTGFALDEPRQEVIDACLRAVLKGKRPTLGHRMLAQLGGLLRLDIILTTNFDDLLEAAFEEARNSLTVFDLHLGSNLPAWSAVASQRSLIKLHGNRHSLRADYTLDASPPAGDLWRFVDYLTGGESQTQVGTATNELQLRNHLLVVGASAAERRTSAFISHAWEHLPDFTVFWVCHSPTDVDRVRRLTAKCQRLYQRDQGWLGSLILRHTNPGLLFLHAFQFLRQTLPTAGLLFPLASRLSIPPLPSAGRPVAGIARRTAPSGISLLDKGIADSIRGQRRIEILRTECLAQNDMRQQLSGLLRDVSHARLSPLPRLIAVTSPPEVHGVTSVCAGAFEDVEHSAACIWLELNDVATSDDLFEQMLGAVYYQLGTETWLPVSIADDTPARAAELRRLATASTRPWIFFLNARETPGSNKPDYEHDSAYPNNWIDKDTGEDTATRASFVSLLSQLCQSNAGCPSITIVLPFRSVAVDSQTFDIDSPLYKDLAQRSLIGHTFVLMRSEEMPNLDPKSVATKCLDWIHSSTIGTADARRRFLHRLVLMQRTRFLSSVSSVEDGGAIDDDAGSQDNWTCYQTWIEQLANEGLVRQKLGGFIWLHANARNSLRNTLASDVSQVAQLQWELALWYNRVLGASQSPYALFESLYHTCQSAKACWQLNTDEAREKACLRLSWATSILKQHGFLVQTLGYSRGSCRRLELIRDDLWTWWSLIQQSDGSNEIGVLFSTRIRRLRIACTEAMRAIAREVGEVTRAYERHRQLRALLVCNDAGRSESTGLADLAAACECSTPAKGTTSEGPHVFLPPLEWVRWWKWNGMLALASRSYSKAIESLSKGLRSAALDKPPLQDDLLQCAGRQPQVSGADEDAAASQSVATALALAQRRPQRFWGSHYQPGDAAAIWIEVLRTVEQYVACRIQQHNLDCRLNESKPTGLGSIDRLVALGSRLAESLASAGDDQRVSGLLAWCQSRLCLHRGHLASFRDDHGEAMKWFTDAEALLDLHDLRRFGTDRAIVELYRAEAGLRRAENSKVVLADQTAPSFGECIDRMVRLQNEQPNAAVELTNLFHRTETSVRSSFREAAALVRDATRFLNRAEDILARDRRNAAWITWYFHRRLRAISLSVWASVTDGNELIPFLGVEAALEGTPTAADTLLQQAARIIRMDVYRLATIVNEYSLSAMAMRARLLIDHNLPRLTRRQHDMHGLLCRAIEQLKDVYHKRTTGKNADDNRKLCDECRDYCQNVIRNVEARCNSLRHIVR